MKNKRVLITGASAGIGFETTKQMLSLGADVVAIARRMDSLKALQKDYPNLTPISLDVKSSMQKFQEVLGDRPIDILVNNAGLARGRNRFEEMKEEDWDEMIDTNIRALVRITRFVVPQMIARNEGDIVNIGSIAGLFTYGGGSIYCSTKFAVHALSQAWRQDFIGKNIRVIEICPGMVETEFSVVRFDGDRNLANKVYEGMTPLFAKDIAESIVWSLSRPRHVNIQNMVIMPTDQAAVGQVHRKP